MKILKGGQPDPTPLRYTGLSYRPVPKESRERAGERLRAWRQANAHRLVEPVPVRVRASPEPRPATVPESEAHAARVVQAVSDHLSGGKEDDFDGHEIPF